jgi:hypothetical protein
MGLRKINAGRFQPHCVDQLAQLVHQELMEKMAQQLMQQLVHRDLLVLKGMQVQRARLVQQVQPDPLVQLDQTLALPDQKVTLVQREQLVLLDLREIQELLGQFSKSI